MLLAGAALKVDENGIRASNHVVVGHDVAVGGNEEAGTEGALRTGLGIAAAAFELFKKTLKFRGSPRNISEGIPPRCMTFFSVLILTTALPADWTSGTKSGTTGAACARKDQ